MTTRQSIMDEIMAAKNKEKEAAGKKEVKGSFVKVLREDLKQLDGFDILTLSMVNYFHNHSGLSLLTYNYIFDDILFPNEEQSESLKKKKSRTKKKIDESLKKLEDMEYVAVYKKDNDWVLVSLLETTSPFVKVYEETIMKIYGLDIDTKKKDSLVATYITICSHIWQGSEGPEYCYPSVRTISQETGLAKQTIEENIVILEQNCLLYVYRCGWYKNTKGLLKQSKNFYSLEFIPYFLSYAQADTPDFAAWADENGREIIKKNKEDFVA